MLRTIACTIFCVLICCSLCFSETLYLKNGKVLEGQIVEQNDTEVKIKTLGLTLTYYRDEIEKIESATEPLPAAYESKSTIQAHSITAQPSVEQMNAPELPKPALGASTQRQLIAPSASLEPTSPQDPSLTSMSKQELILDYIEASGTKDTMTQALNQIVSEGSPEDVQRLRAIFNVDEILARLVPVYDAYFTKKDLQGLIAFYRSELGQKMIRVTPLIMQDSMNISMQYFQEKAAQQRVQQ